MFWFGAQEKRELAELRARVETLEREVDMGELERLRRSVLTALRALRRAEQAAAERGELPVADPRQLHIPGTVDPRLAKLRQDVGAHQRRA